MDYNPTAQPTRPEPTKAGPASPFPGFKMPDQNWTKLPNEMIEAMHMFETMGEVMVVLYVLRHTWGFQEYGITKRITLDEFQHGRKRRDSSRLDSGTGLSLNAVKDGIRRAVAHGFLLREVEHWRDPGRRSYLYSLRMSNSDPRGSDSDTPRVRDQPPDDQSLTPRRAEPDTRSEKETRERNGGKKEEKEEEERQEGEPFLCPLHHVPMGIHCRDGETRYSHQLPDGSWCNGRRDVEPSPVTYREWTPEERHMVNTFSWRT